MGDLFLPITNEGISGFSSLLSRSERRCALGLRATAILSHFIFVGPLFILDGFLIKKTRSDHWIVAAYLVFLVVTLAQYVVTACSSPGYVIDAMKAVNGARLTFSSASYNSEQPFSGNGSSNSQMHWSAWLNLVMGLYPPGQSPRSWTCRDCNIIQPPRSKHCDDCNGCILQFDHHCTWLGTCIGKGNHCKFWWYVFEETVLCIWTASFYITFLRLNNKAWWKDFIGIVLLSVVILCLIFVAVLLLFHSYLILTNQTTYEIIRKGRLPYLSGIPKKSHPFSKGICRNLYAFCCSRDSIHTAEAIPPMEELEARARPYTCFDIITCRCC